MLKRAPVVAIAAVAVAAAIPFASAPAAPTGSFTLIARLDRHSMVRVDAPPKGTSAGDVFVFSAGLRRDGKAGGRAEFVQTVVDPGYRGISMQADLLLSDGTLELRAAGLSRRAPGAAKPSAETDMAIVGGTGAYAGATGSIRLVPTGRTSQQLRVTLGS
jgi:hypothetical protein